MITLKRSSNCVRSQFERNGTELRLCVSGWLAGIVTFSMDTGTRMHKKIRLSLIQWAFVLCIVHFGHIFAKVEFKNLKCFSHDLKTLDFELCHIKAVNRSYSYLSVKANMFRAVDNVTVGIKVVKKANGYKPFLYDITFDACQFMKNRRNPLISYFFSFISDDSNINHPCPYEHDIYVEKLSNNKFDSVLQKLPMPYGDYGVLTTWWLYNQLSATVELYASVF